jgi:membrane-bound metal-dependent hydrolase YbcI (DUF457 family)
MEPVTHLLASATLAQAGLRRTTRLALPMAIVAGMAADADWLSAALGPQAYLAYHRTFAHSLLGLLVISAGVAGLFLLAGRSAVYRRFFAVDGEVRASDTVRLPGALLTCFAAGLLHVLLDTLNPHGVQLLWPGAQWFALDLLPTIDPVVLATLVCGLLVPVLLRLVLEEIGAAREQRGAQRGALIALAVLAAYIGLRWTMHGRVLALLDSHQYHQATARQVAAFPASASPLHWMGVAETANTFEELEVRVGGYFDPDSSRTNYKPESQPALEAARETATVKAFLRFARFPSATIVSLPENAGFRVELRDVRFIRPAGLEVRRDVLAIVEVDPQMRVTQGSLVWARDYRR